METTSVASQQEEAVMSEEEDGENEEEDEDGGQVVPKGGNRGWDLWGSNKKYGVGRESFHFAGHDIIIQESMDSYGAVIWPGAVALCQFLENNQEEINLKDKCVLEIGAGTGLLSIVATLLGASVTATDLPEILGNLTFNIMRNTRRHCRHMPQTAALTWGHHLQRDYPWPAHHYDYVLAADVVYHHDFLNELLVTMAHFCQPGTTLLLANKIRFPSDELFLERFESTFSTTLLIQLQENSIRIYRATAREGGEQPPQGEEPLQGREGEEPQAQLPK